MDQHVLVVIGHVEILIKLIIVVIIDLNPELFLLDGKLSIQMLQEWHEFITHAINVFTM